MRKVPKPKWLNDAIKSLDQYNTDPFIDKFMDDFNFSFKGKAKSKLDKIKQMINKPDEPPFFEDLVDYMDQLKMNGKQHIFLYTFKGSQEYLNELHNPGYIKKRLRKFNPKNLFNKSKLVWNAPKPKLAEVKHSFKNGEGRLLFKWVKSRSLPAGLPKERSVNFFIIDLKDGNSEIRIQSLQTESQQVLRDELKIFKEEISKYINFNLFSPVALNPAIKSLLQKPFLPITNWEIEYPGGKKFRAVGDPKHFDRIGLFFKNFKSRETTIYWECNQEATGRKRLFFKLNGENDEIRFNGITDKSKVDFILNQLRELSIGAEDNILAIYDHSNDKCGMLGYAKRKVEKHKRSKILKPTLTAIFSFLYGVIFIPLFKDEVEAWMQQKIFQVILPGVPLIIFQVLILLMTALLFFGSNTFRRKIPKVFLTIMFVIGFGSGGKNIKSKFDKMNGNEDKTKKKKREKTARNTTNLRVKELKKNGTGKKIRTPAHTLQSVR